jgi:hypothetical protein
MMPKVDGGGHGCRWVGGRGSMESVEVTRAIEASDLHLGQVVLHR